MFCYQVLGCLQTVCEDRTGQTQAFVVSLGAELLLLGVGLYGADSVLLGCRASGDGTSDDDRLLLEARTTAGDTSVGDGTLLGPRMLGDGTSVGDGTLLCSRMLMCPVTISPRMCSNVLHERAVDFLNLEQTRIGLSCTRCLG